MNGTLDVFCPRGDQGKVEVLEFCAELLTDEQVDARKDDGLVGFFPRQGLLSQRRCLLGWEKM